MGCAFGKTSSGNEECPGYALVVWRRQKIPFVRGRSAVPAKPREPERGYHLFQSHY
jgi:hypothetical protein